MAWTACGDLSAAKRNVSGAGASNAAFMAGGYTTAIQSVTEEFDGMSWSAGGTLGTARMYQACAGTIAAGIAIAGYTPTEVGTTSTEEYDGTSWSAGGSLTVARYSLAGFGTQTSAVAAGHTGVSNSEEYDGTSWVSGGTMPAARAWHSGCGTLSAGLVCGGTTNAATDTAQNTSYEYDGTTWTSGGTLATARATHGVSGSQTNGLAIAGTSYSGGWTNYSSSEKYNGTTWSNSDSLSAAKRLLASAGADGATGIAFGGYTGTVNLASTELYYSGGALAYASALSATFAIPSPDVPLVASPLTGTFTVPAPTISSSIKVLPDPLTATFTVPTVTAGVGVVAVDPLTGTFTMPSVTVSLPCIVVVSPLTGTFYVLDPYVVASQKSILFGAYNFPNGKTMSYKIVDDTGAIIQNYTTTGVVETVVDATADKSTYTVRTNKVNENFQGQIMWKSSDATPLTAVEIINIYSSYVDILQNRLTSGRATNLDDIPTRLAAADYTAPDNAGIVALLADTALLIAFIKNKKYLEKTGATWYLVIRNADDSADILRKALKGTNGTTEITDIAAAAMGMEIKSSV